MARTVIHSDIELFLTGHIRDRLAAIAAGPTGRHKELATGVHVDNKFPNPEKPKTVVVRDDGGPTTGLVTKETSVGVTILAGEDITQPQDATDLALLVAAIVSGCPGTGGDNPVAAVLEMNGPSKVYEESGRPRRYFTANLAVTGKEFT